MKKRHIILKQFKYWLLRRPCFGGLLGAVIFFALTMTPTLIPRGWQLQGMLAGLTAAIGYGIGVMASKILRHTAVNTEPKSKTKKRSWVILCVCLPLVIGGSVFAGAYWDKQLRQLMSMPLKEPWQVFGMVGLSVIFTIILVLISRLLRLFFHLVARTANRLVTHRVSTIAGYLLALFFVVYVLVGGLARSLFSAIDYAASISNNTIQSDLDQPKTSLRSGSPESLITWDQLGAKGREFIAGGPTVSQIESFTGSSTAVEPIRIYGGLKATATIDERVNLVMKELDRTKAYERKAIFIQTPSGNGEIPPVNADAPEYILNGDTAQVALQYSYAPSATTMLTNPGVGSEAGRKLVNAVVDKVNSLPQSNHPKVYVAGESLGSLSTEAAFDDANNMKNKVDGVLMVGPTFLNKIRTELLENKADSSPVWLPIIDDGQNFRFASDPADLSIPKGKWQKNRIVYLANSSDPVGWFNIKTIYSKPSFLEQPRAKDVSPSMHWVPIVTFWQQLLDLQFASGAPAGHGHRYGLNVVDGWASVINADGWTSERTAKLRTQLQPVLDEYLSPK